MRSMRKYLMVITLGGVAVGILVFKLWLANSAPCNGYAMRLFPMQEMPSRCLSRATNDSFTAEMTYPRPR
jgi:hypothetical protein